MLRGEVILSGGVKMGKETPSIIPIFDFLGGGGEYLLTNRAARYYLYLEDLPGGDFWFPRLAKRKTKERTQQGPKEDPGTGEPGKNRDAIGSTVTACCHRDRLS